MPYEACGRYWRQDQDRIATGQAQPGVSVYHGTRSPGIDAESILNEHNLSRQMFSSPDLFVPAMVIYRLTEAVAETASDPYLGVSVGESLDLYSWPPFVSATSKPDSISDLFLSFATNANNLASSVEIQLLPSHARSKY